MFEQGYGQLAQSQFALATGGIVGTGLGQGSPGPDPVRRDGLHLRGDRRGARAARHDRGPAAVRGARRQGPAGSRSRPATGSASCSRSGSPRSIGAADVRDRRRRDPGDPAHRRDAAVRVATAGRAWCRTSSCSRCSSASRAGRRPQPGSELRWTGRSAGSALGLLVLFVILFAQVNYIQVFAADRIANDPANAKRQLIGRVRGRPRQRSSPATRRTVLASSRRSSGDFKYQRRYAQGALYAHLTGLLLLRLRAHRARAVVQRLPGGRRRRAPPADAHRPRPRPRQARRHDRDDDRPRAPAGGGGGGGRPSPATSRSPRSTRRPATCSRSSRTRRSTRTSLASQDPEVVRDAWDELNADPEKPLVSRASDELFPPGSTFKIVTAAAALENGFGPDSTWAEPARARPAAHRRDARELRRRRTARAGRADHARVRPSRSRATSRSARSASSSAPSRLAEQARAFGFTAEAGEDVDPVRHPVGLGRVPRRRDVRAARAGRRDLGDRPAGRRGRTRCTWRSSRRRSATAASMMEPQLVTEVRDPSGQVDRRVRARGVLRAALAATNAARAHGDDGRGRRRPGPGPPRRSPASTVAGKTGTAQHGEGADPHAWFVSFAPAQDAARSPSRWSSSTAVTSAARPRAARSRPRSRKRSSRPRWASEQGTGGRRAERRRTDRPTGDARRALPRRARARPGRHGQGLPGPGHRPRPDGRGQDPRAAVRRRPELRRRASGARRRPRRGSATTTSSSVFDTGSDDGVHFIVMEYVEGRTLADFLAGGGRIMPDRAIEIAIDVCGRSRPRTPRASSTATSSPATSC